MDFKNFGKNISYVQPVDHHIRCRRETENVLMWLASEGILARHLRRLRRA